MAEHPGRQWVPQWTLADRLRKIRRDSGLSQEDMAYVLGVGVSAFAAWEAGRNMPTRPLELADAIEREFDVPAAWTLGLLDRPPARGSDYVAAIPVQRRRATDRVACVY